MKLQKKINSYNGNKYYNTTSSMTHIKHHTVQKLPPTVKMMPEISIQIQIQSIVDEMKQIHMRMERVERRTQMLTDSFVVAGLWRTSSALPEWKGCENQEDEDMLQFEMTND